MSSQSGCTRACAFCATATIGFRRNLTAGEIVRQYLVARDAAEAAGLEASNVVFMGMGEPLDNLDPVLAAVRSLTDVFPGLSPRRVTVSATQIIHAYKQAPWRVQRQYVGAFLLAVIGISMIAALYLQVTAGAARAGREIQEMRFEITTIQRANADLETQLANLTSTAEMERRALEMDFRPVKPGELDYLAVPGFVAPEPAILLAAVDVTQPEKVLPPEYSQSLLEWFDERIKAGGPQ